MLTVLLFQGAPYVEFEVEIMVKGLHLWFMLVGLVSSIDDVNSMVATLGGNNTNLFTVYTDQFLFL